MRKVIETCDKCKTEFINPVSEGLRYMNFEANYGGVISGAELCEKCRASLFNLVQSTINEFLGR
jgi:hypothetical protein